MLTVIKPGPQLSVQDLGRVGHRHLGISQCGAIDSDALRIANMLVGNDENAPALEITLGMAKLEFQSATLFALSGADLSANLDGKRIDVGWCYEASAGQVITFATSAKQLRCYLAIAGGFEYAPMLGSTSVDMMAQLGANNGQLLQANDIVPYQKTTRTRTAWGAHLPQRKGPIHFIADPRPHGLQASAADHFATGSWSVSAQSNRMGLRLATEYVEQRLQHSLSIRTTAVCPGTIQVPPSGEPIVLLNDCQTTGGYPILGQVISADLPRLGQYRGGDALTFKAVTIEDAVKLNHQHQAHFNRLRIAQEHILA